MCLSVSITWDMHVSTCLYNMGHACVYLCLYNRGFSLITECLLLVYYNYYNIGQPGSKLQRRYGNATQTHRASMSFLMMS